MSLIFFVAAFIALLAAAFMVANSENSKATFANEKAESALKHTQALDGNFDDINAKITDLSDKLIEIRESIAAQTKKYEWIEMKVQNQPRATPPSRVVLSQDKPLEITVYEEGPRLRQQKVNTEIKGPLRRELIKNVKKQMQELSK